MIESWLELGVERSGSSDRERVHETGAVEARRTSQGTPISQNICPKFWTPVLEVQCLGVWFRTQGVAKILKGTAIRVCYLVVKVDRTMVVVLM